MSPTGMTPNGSLVNIHLPNWHKNVARYDDFFQVLGYGNLSFHVLRSNSVHSLPLGIYHLLLGLWILVLSVPDWVMWGPGTDIHAMWFGTVTKLLHHSAALSIPSVLLFVVLVVFLIISKWFLFWICHAPGQCLVVPYLLWHARKMCFLRI